VIAVVTNLAKAMWRMVLSFPVDDAQSTLAAANIGRAAYGCHAGTPIAPGMVWVASSMSWTACMPKVHLCNVIVKENDAWTGDWVTVPETPSALP
jgi:hypothetical protein